MVSVPRFSYTGERLILKQYYLGCLAHASYLLGDEATSTAIVVDPQRDIQQYLDDAAKLGLQIRHVFLTHFHADFVAGHLELRDRCGATIHLGSRAKAEYAFAPMKDGDRLDFPGMRLEVLETPGHTIESISILVFDLRKDAANHTLLLPATLFLSETSGARTCERRSAGQPGISGHGSTTPCTSNSCRFLTRPWCIRRMALDLCVESSSPQIPYPRLEISAG